MGIFSGLFKSRDKPKDSYDSPSYSYYFGRTQAGKRVNDRTALQIIAVYACVHLQTVAGDASLDELSERRMKGGLARHDIAGFETDADDVDPCAV